jgi:LysR family glycine cleavage system transcriptional activator
MQDRNGTQPPRLPSLDLLKGFEAAARLLSFTKAGEELYLSQSAVSRQIQDLEDQLGVRLFQRRHRALALTEAGQTLYPAAAQVLATMRAATDRLRAAVGRKTVAVTTTQSLASLWLIPRLGNFTRVHPEVDVRISAETRVLDLARDGLDLAIRHGPPGRARSGYSASAFSRYAAPSCSGTRNARCASRLTCATKCCCNTTIRKDAIPGCTGGPGWRSSA